MTTRFMRTIPTLRISVTAKARECSPGLLGFKVDFEHRSEPDLPLFMQVSMGDVVLYLSEHHGDCSPGAKIVMSGRLPRRPSGEAIRLCPPRARRPAMGRHLHDHRRSVLQSHRVQRAPLHLAAPAAG